MDTLETISYKRDITDDEAARMVNTNTKIQHAMKNSILGDAPVYIVTGLKIAKGFHLTSEFAKNKGFNIGAAIPITEEIAAGADFDVSHSKTFNEQSSTAQDIVFAYQLHAVANKGWWKKRRVNVDVYAPKAAALGSDDRTTQDAVAVEEATLEDLDEALIDFGDVTITEHTVCEGEGGIQYDCVAFRR
jgi:long-subunit fatty acid transport protein